MTLPRLLAIGFVAAIAVATVVIPATAASANTPPNPYSPAGTSWVTVPTADRVYLENFGGSDYDDYPIYEVSAGITCTHGGVTATGPFLTAENLGSSDCVDATSTPVSPIDTSTRTGSLPFGFPIDFYGTTYTSAYPNTNGGIFFDNPDNEYDYTLAELASYSQSSAMFPLGADLEYFASDSNFWTAHTTVNGSAAVVFSWEKFHSCCDASPAQDMTFQLVLIDKGSGDFDAWFNYSSFAGFDQGYEAPAVLIDLSQGVTVGSNVIVVNNASGVPTACTESHRDQIGNPTDTTFASDLGGAYFKLDDAVAQTISVWSDSSCTVPINVNVVQDVATDQAAYIQLTDDNSTYNSVGTGWSTYSPTTKAVQATELLQNVDSNQLLNTAPDPLTSRSLNTTVPGRFVIGQRAAQPSPTLPRSGSRPPRLQRLLPPRSPRPGLVISLNC